MLQNRTGIPNVCDGENGNTCILTITTAIINQANGDSMSTAVASSMQTLTKRKFQTRDRDIWTSFEKNSAGNWTRSYLAITKM